MYSLVNNNDNKEQTISSSISLIVVQHKHFDYIPNFWWPRKRNSLSFGGNGIWFSDKTNAALGFLLQ